MPSARIYPCSPAKRRITVKYDILPDLLAADLVAIATRKKLKRMPHIFPRVLELPCDADFPVSIEEKRDSIVFVITQPGLVAEEVRAEVEEIVPGAIKVVIGGSDAIRAALEELEIDLWRFRLPACTLPEASTATYVKGVLTVAVPKAPSASRILVDSTLFGSDNEASSNTEDMPRTGSGLNGCSQGEADEKSKDPFHSTTSAFHCLAALLEAFAAILIGKAFYCEALPCLCTFLKANFSNEIWDWLAALH